MFDKYFVIAADKTYLLGVPLFISKVGKLNTGLKVSIYLFHQSLDSSWMELFKRVFDEHVLGELKFVDISNEGITSFPSLRGSILTYARLLIPKYLPPECESLIYCDVDFHVIKGFGELEELNFEGNGLIAVQDYTLPTLEQDSLLYPEGYDLSKKYFNAGLMRINLKYWRENNIMEKALELVLTRGASCTRHDQSVLNYLLHDETIFVDPSNNAMIGLGSQERAFRLSTNINVHFVSVQNPWNFVFHRKLIRDWRKDFISDIGVHPFVLGFKLCRTDFLKENLRLFHWQIRGVLRRTFRKFLNS